jgi:hypothetical protein
MQFQCDACQKIIEYEPTTSGGATPSGWRNHIIGPSRVFLCGACGNPAHFSGGLSPYLRQLLLARGIDIGNE